MLALLASFVGGIIALLSPCILPILPLLFARTGRSFARETLPMLGGLALSFTVVAAAGSIGAHTLAVAHADQFARIAALVLLGVVGASLLLPRAAAHVAAPAVRLGARLDAVGRRLPPTLGAFVIGGSLGLLWAPCAGPLLGLVVVAALRDGTVAGSAALYGAFALGTAVGLACVLGAGEPLMRRIRAAQGQQETVRRALGALVLAGVLLIAAGWDRAFLARFNFVNTAAAEERIARGLGANARASLVGVVDARSTLPALPAAPPLSDEGPMPGFGGGGPWINSAALTPESLRGKVVLVDFWTFACINCLHALPHVKALYAKYKDRGFVVVGVHTPELPFERVEANVRSEVKRLGVDYPVVIDEQYKIWNAFHNEYWPAAYFVDANGRIRFHHFGEGRYDDQDAVVARLLAEAGR